MIRKQLPNFLTLLNLLSGCLSIVFLFSGNLVAASWMIGIAAIFDFLDGFLARMLKASSEIGKVLDSLADVVSFGVAPGMILFMMIQLWGDTPEVLSYTALFVPALSAVRLAIFATDARQKYHFIGIPTPLNGLMIASLPLVLSQYGDGTHVHLVFSNQWFLVGLAVISSIMLIAPVKVISLKFSTFYWKDNISIYALIILFILLATLTGYLVVPLIYLLYILFSFFDPKLNNKRIFYENE